MGRIRFSINYEVKEKRKFEEFLSRYEKEVGLVFKELTISRYWKCKSQFQASFILESRFQEKEKRIYEILILANQLWSGGYSSWSINGPYDKDTLVFECILNNENEGQPLKWAHIELENE